MARIAGRVVVADHGVDLKGARAAIVQIVPGRIPPADDQEQPRPQGEHSDHAESEEQQWVCTQADSAPRTDLRLARRLCTRCSRCFARRGFMLLRVLGAQEGSTLGHRGDARRALPISITLDGTMAQGAAWHDSSLLSDAAKQDNNIYTK